MKFIRPHDQLVYINTGSSSGLQKEHKLSNRKMSKNRLLLIKYLKKHDTSGNFFKGV